MQADLVAAHQGLEGVVVAAPDERDQALVALQAKEGRAPMKAGDAGVLECGDFHEAEGLSVRENPPGADKLLGFRVAAARLGSAGRPG